MSKAAFLALADRVQALTGPCREIDERIGMAIGLKRTMRVGHECLGTDRVVPVMCPHYTASLDAAMTLAPEGWRIVSLGDRTLSFQVILSRGTAEFSRGEPVFGYAATPALALTAAALRAIAAQMTEGD